MKTLIIIFALLFLQISCQCQFVTPLMNRPATSTSSNIILIDSSGNQGTGTISLRGINTVNATVVYAFLGDYAGAGSLGTISDSRGNTWSQVASYGTSVPRSTAYVCYPVHTSATDTITYTNVGGYFPALVAVSLKGTPGSSDIDNYNGVVTTSGTQTSSLSVNSSVTSDIVFFAVNGYNSITPTISGAGWISVFDKGLNGGVSFGLWYQIPSAATNTATLSCNAGGFGIAGLALTGKSL